MNTSQLVESLKENGEDFEFYPTTDAIISRLARDIQSWAPAERYHYRGSGLSSVLDIGAGNGKVLEALRKADCGLSSFYAIEKSSILCGQLPESVFIVGTAFEEQSLLSKVVDVIFSNPPYSVFESWAVKIIREAACQVVYLVIPERWESSDEIKAALAHRGSKARKLGEFDFLSADRKARCKVHLLRIDLESSADEAFESFFSVEFADLKAKFEADKSRDDDERKAKRDDGDKAAFASLVVGDSYPEAMVNLYGLAMARISRNYQLVSQLDVELLREFGISPVSVCKLLKERLAGLRVLYWHELFSKMRAVTDRLTSKSRDSLLGTLQKNCHVDFTVSNIHAVLLWAIRNANRFVESQFIETYEYMVDSCNVVAYKSNQRVFKFCGWAYRHGRDNVRDDVVRFALDYRIVMSSCGGINVSHYSWEKTRYDGLCERAYCFIQDLLTVANNLGFLCSSSIGGYEWHPGKPNVFYFSDRKGKRCVLFEVRAFKNQNMHVRLSKRFALALNVEHGRLRGWLRSPAEACEELRDNEAGKFWGATFRLLPDSGMKFLAAPSVEIDGDSDFEAEESAAPCAAAPPAAAPAPVVRAPAVSSDAREALALTQKWMGRVPEFRASIMGIARVAGLQWSDVFKLWLSYADGCADGPASVNGFIESHAGSLGGNVAALEAAAGGELGLAA